MLCSFQSTNGGDEEDRTPDPLRARQVLSQLSYTPICIFNKIYYNHFVESCQYYFLRVLKNPQN